MKKIVVLMLFIVVSLFGVTLTVESGSIKAHTEVFGDSTIEPYTKNVFANLVMDRDDITSLRGEIYIYVKDLVSDNEKRDEHMYEALESEKFPKIVLSVNGVTKSKEGYILHAQLKFHGTTKTMDIPAKIIKDAQKLSIASQFSIKYTDYGIEPITLLFLTVRDRVDINADIHLKEAGES